MPADDERIPQAGDTVLVGSRSYVITAIDTLRGWWFEATALDKSTRLLGNEPLRWDEAVQAWRPEEDAVDTHSPPRHMRLRTRRTRESAEGGNRV